MHGVAQNLRSRHRRAHGKHLLSAAKECDERYSAEIEAAWRYVMDAGIAFLKARYDGPV